MKVITISLYLETKIKTKAFWLFISW